MLLCAVGVIIGFCAFGYSENDAAGVALPVGRLIYSRIMSVLISDSCLELHFRMMILLGRGILLKHNLSAEWQMFVRIF